MMFALSIIRRFMIVSNISRRIDGSRSLILLRGSGSTFKKVGIRNSFQDFKYSLIQGRRHRLQYKKKVDPDLVVDIKPSLRFVNPYHFIKHHRMDGILRFHLLIIHSIKLDFLLLFFC